MAFSFKKFWAGLNIVPKTVSTSDSQGDLEVLDSDGKLQYHDGISSSPVVTEEHVATLENKSLSDDSVVFIDQVDPTIQIRIDAAGTTGTSTMVQSSQTVDRLITFPDKDGTLAVTTDFGPIQNQVDDLIDLTGVPANSTDLGTFTGSTIPDNVTIKAALQSLETGLEDHITDPIDAHEAEAISFVPTANIQADDVQEAIQEVDDNVLNEFSHQGSTGLSFGGVLTINADPTKFDLAAGEGWAVDSDDFSNPVRTRVTWNAFTAQTVTNLLVNPVTYISINPAGAIVQQASFPTPEEKRDNIFIGRLNHANLTNISFADTFPDILQSEQSQYYDLVDAIGPFNYQGNLVSANGVNLSIDKSAGKLFNASFNYATNNQSPNNVTTAAQTPATFVKQTQTANNGGDVTVVDPANYDVAGVVTAVPGAGTVATVQRVYLFPSNNIRIQYGQAVYANLAEALAEFDSEEFIENPTNTGVAVLIGFIAVTKAATDLSDPAQARVITAPKFGGATGAASAATTNLQQAYDNSVTPEITTNSSLGALSIKRGSASDTDNVLEIQNGAGTNVLTAKGDGSVDIDGQLDVDNINLNGSTVSVAGTLTLTGSPSQIALGTNISKVTNVEILAGASVYTPSSNAVTGANAQVTPGNNKVILLTNASLSSIDTILAAFSGQEVTLVNDTGVDVVINNDAGGVYGIYTGTGSAVTLKANAAFNFTYDGVASRWHLVGGTGSGSGSTGTSDPDVMFTQNFDTAVLGDFTQTGLSLNTADSMHGAASAKLTHQPATSQSFAQTISVNPKFRGVNITAAALIRSTASSGNVTLTVTDVTNSATLTTQSIETDSQAIASLGTTNASPTVTGFTNSVINDLKVGMSVTGSGIPAGTEILSISTTALTVTLTANATATATVTLRFSELPKTVQLGFSIPANCASISYTVTALQESGSPETYIDDIVFKNYFLGMSNQGQTDVSIEVPNVTAWTSFTPTGSWTTNTTYSGKYRQVGENLELEFALVTSGAPTAIGLLFNLPAGFNIDTNKIISTDNDSYLGYGIATDKGVNEYPVIVTFGTSTSVQVRTNNASSTYVTSAANVTNIAPFTWGASDILNVKVSVPCLELTATTTQSFTTTDLVPAKAVLGNTTLTIPNVSAWTSYTPTFTGFGTPSAVEFQWRQNGENVDIRGKFTSGTSTATEARIGLPAGLTSAGTSVIPSIQMIGDAVAGTSSATYFRSLALIEPSVSYITLGNQTSTGNGLTKILGTSFPSTTISVTASVPCTGLSATEEVVVSGTQAALVQQPDSMIRLNSANGYGSTGTKIPRFSSILSNIGSDILYADSATNGSSFTIVSSGVYSFSFATDRSIGVNTMGLSLNATGADLSTNIDSLSAAKVLNITYVQVAAGQPQPSVSWTGYLVAGDVVRPHTQGVAAASASNTYFTASKQGSLSVASTNADQKITIPTSELRFEGASSRGAVATAIVKFDTLAKIRGDAFTVTNTANDGTYVTMTKAGKLDISASFVITVGSGIAITKNQSTLTSFPTVASEILAADASDAAGTRATASYQGFVNVGDIIRVAATAAPTSNATNQLNLSFQEQKIQVSVSNTLPQFSESDSSVRLSGANGYGSSATTTRRFASVIQNIGTDIEYTDSATLGGQFRAMTSGIYNVSFSEQSTANVVGIEVYINVNGVAVAYDNQLYNTATTGVKGANPSWQGYLAAGDIVTGSVGTAANNNGAIVLFTMSKVGKPNVTGVDVTPFIEIPQPETQSSYIDVTASIASGAAVTGATTLSSGSGIYSYNSSTGLYTILKDCVIDISSSMIAAGAASVQPLININGLGRSVSNSSATSGHWANAALGVQLTTGSTFNIVNGSAGSSSRQVVNVTATANSPQILTPPETFSTDTNGLTYAGSGTYTLSTLANAPVGTFITFTYAINSNTRTQTTTAPTQTTADMNANGILVSPRAYNAASTAALPVAFAIQIGKGLKGKQLDWYFSTGKTTPISVQDVMSNAVTATIEYGAFSNYDEKTGVLVVDAGNRFNSSTTVHNVGIDVTANLSRATGYLVINASKNPALTGLGLGTVAARGVNSSGQSISNVGTTTLTYDAVKSYDTTGSLNTSTGVYTVPETGYYSVDSFVFYNAAVYAVGNALETTVHVNGTQYCVLGRDVADSTTSLSRSAGGGSVLFLTKGQLVSIVLSNNRGAGATTLLAATTTNHFAIAKVSIG